MRDELLKFFAAREETVGMGGKQYTVRTMADGETLSDGDNTFLQIVVRCAFDAEGNRAFSDEDIATLKAAPRILTGRLYKAVMRVNGLDAEEEEKNSDAGPGSG